MRWLLFCCVAMAPFDVRGQHPDMPRTRAEWYANSSDIAVAVFLDRDGSLENPRAAKTTYRLKSVLKSEFSFKTGKEVALHWYFPGKKGDLALLLGSRVLKQDPPRWRWAVPISKGALEYVKKVPPPVLDGHEKRLPFFLKNLASNNRVIVEDCLAELEESGIDLLIRVKDQIQPALLRKRLANTKNPSIRFGIYAKMLAICGTQTDLPLLRRLVHDSRIGRTLGYRGTPFAYIQLGGEPALRHIKDTIIKPRWVMRDGKPVLDEKGKKIPVAFGRRYEALNAVDQQWRLRDPKVPRKRLQKTLRLFFANDDLPAQSAMLIAEDLRCWEFLADVMRLFKSSKQPGVKHRAVCYMRAAIRLSDNDEAGRKIAAAAKTHIEAMRETDPKLVNGVFPLRKK